MQSHNNFVAKYPGSDNKWGSSLNETQHISVSTAAADGLVPMNMYTDIFGDLSNRVKSDRNQSWIYCYTFVALYCGMINSGVINLQLSILKNLWTSKNSKNQISKQTFWSFCPLVWIYRHARGYFVVKFVHYIFWNVKIYGQKCKILATLFNPKETSFLDLHRRPKRAFRPGNILM